MDEHDVAWDAGNEEAFWGGYNENPYPFDTDEWRAYDSGYEAGLEDRYEMGWEE